MMKLGSERKSRGHVTAGEIATAVVRRRVTAPADNGLGSGNRMAIAIMLIGRQRVIPLERIDESPDGAGTVVIDSIDERPGGISVDGGTRPPGHLGPAGRRHRLHPHDVAGPGDPQEL